MISALGDYMSAFKFARFERRHIISCIFIMPFLSFCSTGGDYVLPNRITPIDTLIIQSPQATIIPSETSFFINDTAQWLIVSDDEQRFVHWVSLDDNSIHTIDVYKAINRTKKEMASLLVNGIFVQNKDSIFVLVNPTNEIFCINQDGNLINQWTVSTHGNIAQDRHLYSYFSIAPLFVHNSKLIVCQESLVTGFETDKMARLKKFRTPGDVVINLGIDTVSTSYESGKYPSEFLNDYWFETNFSRAVNDSGYFVYSFGVNDTLFVYNFGSLIQTVKAKSKFIDEFDSFDGRRELDSKYVEQYVVEQPRYLRIIFDPYAELYYRVILHASAYQNNDGTINTFGDKEWSVMVLDKSFSIQDEYLMEAKTFDFSSIIPTPHGVLVSLDHDLNPIREVGYMKYAVFNFSQNE
jgi:hypothetical protein